MSTWPIDLRTTVHLHRQDTEALCGPACAQMVLHAVGGDAVDQANLATTFVSPAPWGMTPEALATSITFLQTTPPCYVHRAYSTRVEAVRAMARSLFTHGRPAIALVNGGDHWVVVSELRGTYDPKAGQKTQPKITSLTVCDPYPDLAYLREAKLLPADRPLPPPHRAKDICTTVGHQEEVWGLDDWGSDEFTACETKGPWKGKWVVVCPPVDEPCDMTLAAPAAERAPKRRKVVAKPPVPTPSDFSDVPAILEWAGHQLGELGLGHRREWTRILRASAVCTTHLVKGLEHTASYVLTSVDGGRAGRLLLRFHSETWRLVHAARNPSAVALENLASVSVENTQLVWTRCAETRSPLLPLHEVEGPDPYRILNRALSQLTLPTSTVRFPRPGQED